MKILRSPETCIHKYEKQDKFSDRKVYWFLCRRCGRKWRIFMLSKDHYQINEF